MCGIELLSALGDGNEKSQRPITASTDLKMVLCVHWGTRGIELALGSEVVKKNSVSVNTFILQRKSHGYITSGRSDLPRTAGSCG